MSLTDWWAEMTADREARTRHERHGSGEITFLDEVPTTRPAVAFRMDWSRMPCA